MKENSRSDLDLVNYFCSLTSYARRLGFKLMVQRKSFVLFKNPNEQFYFDTLDEISIFLCEKFGLDKQTYECHLFSQKLQSI